MATQALAGVTPTLYYWRPLTPKPTFASPLTTDPPRPFPVGTSHCAWEIGVTYISAVPNTLTQLMGKKAITYPLEPDRRLDEDLEDFGYNRNFVRMPGLDGAAMVHEGNAILSSGIFYDTRSYFTDPDPRNLDPPFNNATVALLVLVAGMPAQHQRDFRERYFYHRNYDWRSGKPPNYGRFFSTPEHVFDYCRIYNLRGEV